MPSRNGLLCPKLHGAGKVPLGPGIVEEISLQLAVSVYNLKEAGETQNSSSTLPLRTRGLESLYLCIATHALALWLLCVGYMWFAKQSSLYYRYT